MDVRSSRAPSDCTLRLWDLATGELIRTFTGHEDWVSGLAITPDGRHALSGSDDCTLKLWDLGTVSSSRTFTGHEDGVTAVAVTPDGRRALSGSRDWNPQTLGSHATGQTPASRFGGHNDSFVSAVAIPRRRRSAAVTLSGSTTIGTLKLWDLATGRCSFGTFRRTRVI